MFYILFMQFYVFYSEYHAIFIRCFVLKGASHLLHFTRQFCHYNTNRKHNKVETTDKTNRNTYRCIKINSVAITIHFCSPVSSIPDLFNFQL